MRYEIKITDQGTRMDGEKLYGLQITDREWEQHGLPLWMKVNTYDELTKPEFNRYLMLAGVTTMKQMLISAYQRLSNEARTLAGEEWRENRKTRNRIAKRALQEYGSSIHVLAFG